MVQAIKVVNGVSRQRYGGGSCTSRLLYEILYGGDLMTKNQNETSRICGDFWTIAITRRTTSLS